MNRKITSIVVKRDTWYVATVPEMPGVNTHGRTAAAAVCNLEEAFHLVLEAKREVHSRKRKISPRS
jgi:predicted RNase H-like HicB family nuclease